MRTFKEYLSGLQNNNMAVQTPMQTPPTQPTTPQNTLNNKKPNVDPFKNAQNAIMQAKMAKDQANKSYSDLARQLQSLK